MNHFSINAFCLIVGFMLGIGCMFTSTQMIVSIQNKRVAALTSSYYQLESLNLRQEKFYIEKIESLKAKPQRKRSK